MTAIRLLLPMGVDTIDPAVTDDLAHGWNVGSFWINTTSGALFVQKSGGAGAAVWNGFLTGVTPSGTIVGDTDTQTLTNKRITKRTVQLTDAATVTMNVDTTDIGHLDTIGQTTTFANPTGTPTDGQELRLRITSTTGRSISFGTNFASGTTVTLPSATTANKTDYYFFVWSALQSKWHIQTKNVGY